MKRIALFFALIFAAASFPAFADNWNSTSPVREGEKETTGGGVPFDGGFVGGEDIPSAFPIPGLPFADVGSTCGFLPNYDVMCPYGGGGPDVVYSFTPEEDMRITIDLCNSWYDTKVMVFEDDQWTLHGCNDDGCSGPNYPYPYVSHIECMNIFEGHTYYIVIAAYGMDCGDYELGITVCDLCVVEPPAGAQLENEPDCHDDYVDQTNGGCGSNPVAFGTIDCADDPHFLFGKTGNFYAGGFEARDTDWFEFTLEAPAYLRFCLDGCFPSLLMAIQALPDCYHYDVVYMATGGYEETACIEGPFDAGTWWIWIGPSVFTGFDCGTEYLLQIDGLCPPTSTEESSWGTIKKIFR